MYEEKLPKLCEFLQEEMEARGWTDADIEARITEPVDQCAVFLAIYLDDKPMIVDQHTADILSRVFDVSSQFFINLNKSELAQKAIEEI